MSFGVLLVALSLLSPIVDDLPDEFRQPSPALSVQSVVCDGDGVSGKRVQAVYVRGAQQWTRKGETVRNPQSGKCLDAAGNSSADGTRLNIWTCTGGANQNWQL